MNFEVKFILEIKQAWKLYSVWFFIIIGCLPDLYNQAISSGLITQDEVPKIFARLITTISFLGLASRLIQQKKAAIITDQSASTPGIAVVSPVPANVQAALDENTQIKKDTKEAQDTDIEINQAKADALAQSTSSTHLS